MTQKHAVVLNIAHLRTTVSQLKISDFSAVTFKGF